MLDTCLEYSTLIFFSVHVVILLISFISYFDNNSNAGIIFELIFLHGYRDFWLFHLIKCIDILVFEFIPRAHSKWVVCNHYFLNVSYRSHFSIGY